MAASSVEGELAVYLQNWPGLTSLNKQVYAVRVPTGIKPPYIVFFRVSSERVYTHDGADELQRPRFQIDCYGDTYEAARSIANQVILALHQLSATSYIKVAQIDDEQDEFDEQARLYRVILDFYIWHI